MSWLVLVSVCYLIGSFPTAYLAGRLVAGIDIRQVGDGNSGAANVFQQVGHIPGVAVGAVDVSKGCAAIIVSGLLFPGGGAALVGGAASVVGHNWPLFLRFRGGRGAATSMGVFLTLAPRVVLPMILVASVLLFRYRSINLFFFLLYAPLSTVLWLFQYSGSLVGYAVALPVLVGATHYFTSKRVPGALEGSRTG